MADLTLDLIPLAEHPAVTKQRLRQRLTRLIDRLVCALDEIDGDPDLEDCDPPEEDDPAEDCDPGGGNITDEPHDREDGW